MKHKVWIVPHTHYDAEVFIVEKETLEIGYANLVGALRLLSERPEFKFALDQTCYIEPFLKAYPEAHEALQRMIDQGRLEIVGGMHSMPDENMPSGESFIRNVHYGKRVCKQLFGVDVRGGWPIDTFGHHPQIPQLMVKSGFDYAAFQRLMKRGSPSEFYWQGVDGTRLLCHWMTCSYGAFWGVPNNLYEFQTFVAPRIQILASHAMTENIMAPAGADLTPVEPHLLDMMDAYNRSQSDVELLLATPSEYFKLLGAAPDFPTVTDDLNPVFQGCYSARIDVKQWNRALETLLMNGEKVDALAQSLGAESQAGRLWEAWRPVLFNQAHDIIGGCHVDAVFNNTMDRFKLAQADGEIVLEAGLQAIAEQIDTRGDGVAVMVFNSLSWERSDVVECTTAFPEPGTFDLEVRDSSGNVVPSDVLQVERFADGSIRRAGLLFIARDVPAFGCEVYHVQTRAGGIAVKPEQSQEVSSSHPHGGVLRFELDHGWLENAYYRLEFDLWGGTITSLYDKTRQWEVLPESQRMGNLIVKERDFGNFWQYNGPCKGDAFYPQQGRYPLPVLNDKSADYAHTYHGDGNIRQGNAMVEFNISHPYGAGHVSTRVRLYAGIPRIDIHTTLLNNDERVRYRAALPTSIRGGTITYEIPFAALQRPEGEYPAQNWIDYSSDDRGVTLLNRGLPGNNVVDGVMMLSLMKCTALKEGYAEVGGFKLGTATDGGYEKGRTHSFDYAIVPHGSGDWRAVQAYRRGAEFNTPLIAWKPRQHAGQLPAKTSFLKIGGENIVLSAVKACAGGMIVRVYEAEGRAGLSPASIEPAWPVQQAYETNLIELEEKAIEFDPTANRVSLALGPFEIKTVKLIFR
jgi:alpha-mannosidase